MSEWPGYLGPKRSVGGAVGTGGVIVGFLALSVGLIAGLAILRGWVLTKLWVWFVTPTFPSMPELSIAVAIGFALIASLLVPTSLDDEKGATYHAVIGAVGPLLALVMGWIASGWV